MTVSFIHFGIERAKKNSFSTADNIGMDTNAVRLYFQVNLLDYKSAGSSLLLAYSCPIVDSNRNRNLTICSLSKTKCPVEGGKERYIFCEKVRVIGVWSSNNKHVTVFVSKIRLVITRILMFEFGTVSVGKQSFRFNQVTFIKVSL